MSNLEHLIENTLMKFDNRVDNVRGSIEKDINFCDACPSEMSHKKFADLIYEICQYIHFVYYWDIVIKVKNRQ